MIDSGIIILVALGFFFLGVVIVLLVIRAFTPDQELRERLRTYAFIPNARPRQRVIRPLGRFYRLRRRLNFMLAAIGSQELDTKLMTANWQITVTEFVLIRLLVMVVGLVVGWMIFDSPISGLSLAILANLLPGILLRRAIHRRRVNFEGQLVDALVLIQGAVRSGFSLLQAVEVVEKEMQPPIAIEFQRVTREVSLGLSLGQALENIKDRMNNPDLDLIVTAINIHNQVGGNLTTMLNAVTETVRDRDYLFREARVITTQQRYTSYLLSLLPVFMAGILFMVSPRYISQIFQPDIYIIIPIFSLIGIVLGHFALRRITTIEV
jgi:tight adherence protein B